MKELQSYGNPVLERKQEFEERPKAFDELGAVLVHYDKILAQYTGGVSANMRLYIGAKW